MAASAYSPDAEVIDAHQDPPSLVAGRSAIQKSFQAFLGSIGPGVELSFAQQQTHFACTEAIETGFYKLVLPNGHITFGAYTIERDPETGLIAKHSRREATKTDYLGQ